MRRIDIADINRRIDKYGFEKMVIKKVGN